ncbi:phosphoglucosamine mutase [Candidatus Micrarchaeota archaeon]|nr:phosphoglucosamine mutase [Candidatus Micrarchaeota archaeon]
MAKYFGTYGIRGKLDMLTPEFALRMSSAFGEHINGGKVLVGRDARLSGEMLEHAVIAGLLSSGCSVLNLGIVPLSTLEFEIRKLSAAGGVMITASHNPPEWNGLKFADKDSIGISREDGAEIEKVFESGRFKKADWNQLKKVENYPLALEEHADALRKTIERRHTLKESPKVVLDCGNGVASLIAPKLFKEFGCKVTTLNSQLDGSFPGRNSEPTPQNLQELMKAVVALKADMGVAWDGDADRVIFIDEKGGYIYGDKSFALCVDIALRQRKGPVVTTVATSNAVADVAKERGGSIEYVKVGGPYLSRRTKELNAVIAGEEAGGVIWPEVHLGKDGFITALKILERMCKDGRPLSSLIAGMPAYYNSKARLECPPDRKQTVLKKFKEKVRGDGKINDMDGVRIDFDDSWVILRASGTENLMRIFAEARSQKKADEILRKYKRIVEKL